MGDLQMKYLIKGQESKKKIDLLISLTKIESENIIGGIYDHLNRNFSISDSSSFNGCNQPNLSDAIKTLNGVAEIVEKINDLKYIS